MTLSYEILKKNLLCIIHIDFLEFVATKFNICLNFHLICIN